MARAAGPPPAAGRVPRAGDGDQLQLEVDLPLVDRAMISGLLRSALPRRGGVVIAHQNHEGRRRAFQTRAREAVSRHHDGDGDP
jgi:hypothetical protein